MTVSSKPPIVALDAVEEPHQQIVQEDHFRDHGGIGVVNRVVPSGCERSSADDTPRR